MRPRPPASVLLSVGTAAAILLVYLIVGALHLRDWSPWSILGLACGSWWIASFIDGALRRRTGRITAALVSIVPASLWALFVALVVFGRAATGTFDWTTLWLFVPPGILSLVGLPLLRPSARDWYEGSASPRETA